MISCGHVRRALCALKEHAGVVRSTVGMFVDQLRAIMDTARPARWQIGSAG